MKKEEVSEEKLEWLRLKVKHQDRIHAALLAGLFIYYVADRWFNLFEGNRLIFWGVFFIIVIIELIEYRYRKKVLGPTYRSFVGTFKNTYVISMISGLAGFSDLSYDPEGGISWDEIRNCGVVNRAEKELYSCSDLLKGRFRGVWFAVSNVATKRRKEIRYGYSSRDKIIFIGRMISFFLPEAFPTCRGRIQIFYKKAQPDISGQLLEHEIKTGDEQFDQKFAVYSEYEDTPGMILTPEMCERIRRFSQAVGTQIAVAFWDRYVYVAVYGKRQFAVDCYTPIAQQKERFLEDANLLSLAERILLEGEKMGS